MKVPALLLLAAAVPAAALEAPVVLQAVAVSPAHRCDIDWIKAAQATGLGASISDPNKYLTPGATGQAPSIDITNPSKLCDATVWHSLAVLTPVGDAILDPKTHQPVGGVTLKWNDPALQAEWNKGLASQLKILHDADERYQSVDSLARAALNQSEAVAAAAEKTGVAARTDAGTPAALKPLGLTGDAYVDDKGYTLAAPPDAPAGISQDPAELKAAFLQIIADDAPAKTLKPKAPVKGKTARTAAPAPAAYRPGFTVAAFRKSIVDLANAVRGAHAAFAAADYDGALKFLTDPAIAKADDSGAHDGAALSTIDYGLRNLIALRAGAVAAAYDAAKARLKGQTVAAAVAADRRLPANQSSADMATAVLRHLQGVKDYQDLATLYDRQSAHPDSDWMKTNGADVKAALDAYRADAAKTQVVIDPASKGRVLQYSIGGQKVTDTGIAVADLDKSQAYRETIAEAIAQNIGTAPLSAKAQAVLAALRGQGAPGSVVTAPPTKDQEVAAGQVPVQPAVVVAAPITTYDALLKATPAQGFFGRLFSPKGNVDRYFSKCNEAAADEAHARASRRADTESAANDAAAAERERQDAARAQLLAAPSDPDDSPDVARAKRVAALADFDKKANAAVQAAHDGVITADKSYVPADKADADLKAKQAALAATIDAVYTDGINKAVDALNTAYKTKGTKQYAEAAAKSGYDAFYDQKLARVDEYFMHNWKGAVQAAAVAKCKTSLGFDAKRMSGFRDPSSDNVDKYCGVHDGLITLLSSYRGSNKTLPAAPK